MQQTAERPQIGARALQFGPRRERSDGRIGIGAEPGQYAFGKLGVERGIERVPVVAPDRVRVAD